MTVSELTGYIPNDAIPALSPSLVWLCDGDGALGVFSTPEQSCASRRFSLVDVHILECLRKHLPKPEISKQTGIPLAKLDAFIESVELWAPGAIIWQSADQQQAVRQHDCMIEAARLRDIWLAISALSGENHIFHSEKLTDPDLQFDCIETTISHYFRQPHAALGGRTYGEAFCDWLVREGKLKAGCNVIEVGCGLGFFANAVLGRLQEIYPHVYHSIHYTLFDLSPELRKAQRSNSAAHTDKLSFMQGNIESHNFGSAKFDLVISNEVIADLEVAAVSLDDIQNGLTQTDAAIAVRDYGLDCIGVNHGQGKKALVNIGAIHFLETLRECVNPGGSAVLTEYGTLDLSPKAVRFKNHLEFTIQFRHMLQVCNKLGYKADMKTVGEAIGFAQDSEILHFDTFFALARGLLPLIGRELPTIAYTRETLKERLGDLMPDIGNLSFLRLDDPRAFSPYRFQLLDISLS